MEDVFIGRKARNQGKLLVDHPYPCCQGVKWASKGYRLAAKVNGAAITTGIGDYRHTKEDLHQGSFTRSVFPDQRDNLPFVR
jgi:hypothetical protein